LRNVFGNAVLDENDFAVGDRQNFRAVTVNPSRRTTVRALRCSPDLDAPWPTFVPFPTQADNIIVP
jgi:hypothetical protein